MTTLHDRPPVIDGHPETRFWTKAGPVDSEHLMQDDISEIEERQEASISEPGAMALLGFAVGTLIVAWPISGFVPPGTLIATIPPVLVFAGIAQFIGGLVAFRRGNAFAGTAFCAYGANNAVVATFFLLQSTGAIPGTPGSPAAIMLGLELLCFAYVSLILALSALRLNLAYVLILIALVPGFTMAGMNSIYGTGIPAWVGHVGGYCLIASAAFAFYTASAIVLNSTWKVSALPLMPLHRQMKPRDLERSTADRREPVASVRPAAGTQQMRGTVPNAESGTAPRTTRPVDPERGRSMPDERGRTMPDERGRTMPDERGRGADPRYRPDDGGRADG